MPIRRWSPIVTTAFAPAPPDTATPTRVPTVSPGTGEGRLLTRTINGPVAAAVALALPAPGATTRTGRVHKADPAPAGMGYKDIAKLADEIRDQGYGDINYWTKTVADNVRAVRALAGFVSDLASDE